jgi:hypothetical protein
MDQFEKKRFLPIEVLIALAINIVVAVLGYYAIMMWGLFRG